MSLWTNLLAFGGGAGFAALAFPQYCPNCHDPLADGYGYLCARCWRELPRPPLRRRAALALGGQAVAVAFDYSGAMAQAVRLMKFYGRDDIAAVLGREAARRLSLGGGLTAAAVTPVPLHPSRVRERGFDQSRAVAAMFAAEAGLPYCEGLIRRRRNTPRQSMLSDSERLTNLAGAFAPVAGRPGNPPATVILVDDVVHSGATLAGCAAALQTAGVRQVTFAAACG